MGGNGKHWWKFSFHGSSSSSMPKQPPKEFMCPISGYLMADPVVVSSGQTFERVYVQVCRKLGYAPVLGDGSRADFTTVIPNLAMKSTILNWCDGSGVERPRVPEYGAVEKLVREAMGSEGDDEIGPSPSEVELLRAVPDNPPVTFSHAVTEFKHRSDHFYSSSSEESVIAAVPATPLPLTTRPACYSSSSSSSDEALALTLTLNPISSEEEDILQKLKSSEVHLLEEGLIFLRKITRTKEEARVSLCTPRVLSALRPLLNSKYAVVQTNAVASLVNLSLEKPNKTQIVRSGIVPPLIDVLKGGLPESQEHAAGALFSLAIEDDNKTAIGVLGALQPLLHGLRSERTRQDSALALYHLSHDKSNRIKLVKLGAVPTLLAMVKSGELVSRALLILCNMAACSEGRSAMLDANAVDCLVGLLRGNEFDSEATQENCVAALFLLSRGSMRFKGLAREAKAAEVLREIEEKGTDRAREKAMRMLQMMKGRDDEEEMDWEGIMETGALSQPRYRMAPANKHMPGPYSTEF